MKFIGLWILNPLKTSAGQPVASGGFAVWLGGYFLARLIIFVFVDFRVFYERFVAWFHWSFLFLLTFRIFNGRFVAWLHWSFLFSGIFAFFSRDLYHDSFEHFCFRWILHFQRETCRRCGKTLALVCVCGLLLLFVWFGWFWFLSLGKFVFHSQAHSSCWPTKSRTSPAMQEKKTILKSWPCHAETTRKLQSIAPATKIQPYDSEVGLATQKQHESYKVLHLPEKSNLTILKSWPCHAKTTWKSQSTAPATKIQPYGHFGWKNPRKNANHKVGNA